MKKNFVSVFVLLLTLFTAASAQALVLVDTGPGPNDNQFQSTPAVLFAKFHLDFDYTLTDVEGWFTTRTVSTIYLGILRDGGELPNVIVEDLPEGGSTFAFDTIYGQSFDIPQGNEPDWFGVHDVEWVLAAGDYWVQFNLAQDVGMPGPSQNPLDDEAFFEGISILPVLVIGNFDENDALDLGVRIQGITATVPEPASALLFASGILGAFLKRKYA
ncbi:MAG: PEP-CTERM sorting domain-containing protein [Candidatus Omnitrophota bacterium]